MFGDRTCKSHKFGFSRALLSVHICAIITRTFDLTFDFRIHILISRRSFQEFSDPVYAYPSGLGRAIGTKILTCDLVSKYPILPELAWSLVNMCLPPVCYITGPLGEGIPQGPQL